MTTKSRTATKKTVTKKEDKISLIVFKELKNIPNSVYAGFKSSLGAEDSTEFTQTELEKEFKKYGSKKAFIKK